MKKIPTVLVRRIEYKDQTVALLLFYCKYCRRTHQHGGGDYTKENYKPEDFEGHRLAHCYPNRQRKKGPLSPYEETGYNLKIAKTEKEIASTKRAISKNR